MRNSWLMAVFLLLIPATALADKPSKHEGGPPGLAKKDGVPPGLAKKGGLPPGLAKKFGRAPPSKAYVAFDPRYDDRAWFLIDNRWVLRQHFDSSLRIEVRQAFTLPAVPPPVPVPSLQVAFHVVLFE